MHAFDWLQNEFLLRYLAYTEQTEPPKIFHIWSAISGISATLGRRCWIETGLGPTYPNLYVLLVGPPGTRKSSSMNNMKSLIKKHTSVRLAPKDTAGQRQGLITALLKNNVAEGDSTSFSNADIDTVIEAIGNLNINTYDADRHTLYVMSAELRSFLGTNNLDLTGFLIEMYDGEDYDYQLKHDSVTVKDSLINLIGCTTPTEISTLLPPKVIGQGFMSRFVLVHSAKKYKSIPPSRVVFDTEQLPFLGSTMEAIDQLKGKFVYGPGVLEIEDKIYEEPCKIEDSRFLYYIERRHTILLKIACAFAASRLSQVIEKEDYVQAYALLKLTEREMSDALGEFGLSPLTIAQQKLLEYIRLSKGPVADTVLYAVMRNDMKKVDFLNSLAELVNAGKIIGMHHKELGHSYVYKDSWEPNKKDDSSEIDDILQLL